MVVYYFVADNNPTHVHVLRVCDCARETRSSEFDALYEIAVVCHGDSYFLCDTVDTKFEM